MRAMRPANSVGSLVRRTALFTTSGLLMALASCVTTQSVSDEPERWEVEVLRGAQHLGTESVANWPPPRGECLDETFSVPDLPIDRDTGAEAEEVLLAFTHVGEPRGLISINGEQQFTRVDFVDRLASAIASIVVDVTVCAISSAFPGDDNCQPIDVQVEGTSITRRFPSSLLVVGGSNTVRVCSTDGDFLLADGLRLREAPPLTETDAGADAEPEAGDAAR